MVSGSVLYPVFRQLGDDNHDNMTMLSVDQEVQGARRLHAHRGGADLRNNSCFDRLSLTGETIQDADV
ncbi:hypothetical protein EJ110_NYTH04954 [Nymphaea thermarum]|nr:hypothetical protein EJ110_NYTH04954 [Nymphaea thermarum]